MTPEEKARARAIERFRGEDYRRVLTRARDRLEHNGLSPTGTTSLPAPTPAERTALAGLLGTDRRLGAKRTAVELRRLDAAVRNACGLGLIELLEEIGGPLRDRKAEKEEKDTAREALLRAAMASPLHASAEWYRDWLANARARLTRLVTKGNGRLLTQAVATLELIAARTPGAAPLSLATLAVTTTGDTKALGNDTALSGLVLDALAVRAGVDRAVDAEDRRALWEAVDVLPDDVSSRVLVLNLPAEGAGLGEWLTGAARLGVPFQITLHQLTTLPVTVRVPVAYVCENPTILRQAAGRLGPASPPLLCTEGLPSIAFHRLAEAINAGGGALRYHGDFDWPGIAIADAVIRRHGARPWRMTATDYRAGLGENPRPLDGRPRPTPWAPDLGPAMIEEGTTVYEETVADHLLDDLREARPAARPKTATGQATWPTAIGRET